MKKDIFKTTAIFGLFILLGAGCFGGDANTSQDGELESFEGSFMEAFQTGQSMKCDWSIEHGDGVAYIKDGKVRTEFVSEGRTSFMINDGTCNYLWDDETGQGLQFCVSEESQEIEATTKAAAEFNSEQADVSSADPGVDVACEAENIKDKMFNPPKNIDFIDPDAGGSFPHF